MDLYCSQCRFLVIGVEGLKCKIYNSHLDNKNIEVFRLGKCKIENSKLNKFAEKK